MRVNVKNIKLRNFARELRRDSTDAENYFWKYIRNNQLEGIKFRRQQPIGRYVVDFVSFEKKIIIELDGSQHMDRKDKDKTRDEYLKKRGFEVLRFWDNDILKNIEGVLEFIRLQILSPHLIPLPQGARKIRK